MAEDESVSVPAEDCPQITSPPPSALCSLQPQDITMTGMLRNVLMNHFGANSYISHPQLKQFVWKPGDNPGILIESSLRWTPEMTETRPGVIIRRNDVNNQRMGIGDLRQGQPVDLQGFPHYVTFWVGSHTLFCLGGTGAQAEILGTEVQRELTEFGPKILEYLDLKSFRVVQRGAVSILEEATQNFVVPVTVGYAYEERWILKQQAPKLRHISLSLLEEC